MKRFLLALLLAIPARLCAQHAVVVATPPVRDTLAALWNEDDPNQIERAYCGVYSSRMIANNILLYVVGALIPIKQDSAQKAHTDQHGISYTCPVSQFIITIHTHTPATCEEWSTGHMRCYEGGIESYECFPSEIDEHTLMLSGAPFAIVQCDRHALVPYFPKPKDGNYAKKNSPARRGARDGQRAQGS